MSNVVRVMTAIYVLVFLFVLFLAVLSLLGMTVHPFIKPGV